MKTIDVVAAIVEKDGKMLIAQRGAGKYPYLENKWEFPGGKIELGESPEACLIRELREECDVEIEVGEFVRNAEFEYPDFKVNLLVYKAKYVSGEFKLNVHKAIAWVGVSELDKYDFLPAEAPIIENIKNAEETTH